MHAEVRIDPGGVATVNLFDKDGARQSLGMCIQQIKSYKIDGKF